MSINEDLSVLEAAVRDCENWINTPQNSVPALVNYIIGSGNTDEQIMAKMQEKVAILQDKIERVNIVKLKELKGRYSNDSRADMLIRKAAGLFLELCEISFSMSEGIMLPEQRYLVHDQNQEAMDGMRRMVALAVEER